MSDGASYPEICAQVNKAFRMEDLVEYIGWYPEKLVSRGEIYCSFCPIHRDSVFRTLVLNPRNNTYQCEHGKCPGNYPADFLDLLTKVTHKTLPEVIDDAVRDFGAAYFDLSEKQVAAIKDLVAEVQKPPGHPPA